MTNCLRAILHGNPPSSIADVNDAVDNAFATTMYAIRAAAHTTYKLSPGAIAFHRDMILDIPLLADWELLRQQKQALLDKNNFIQNRKRISHDYSIGEEILIKNFNPAKLDERFTGPYTINRVHNNGTVTIIRNNNVTERINVRRIKPYKRAVTIG